MSVAAALVLAMTFSAERSVQAAAGGRVEAMAGVVPDNPFDPSEPRFAFAIVPVAGLSVQRPRYELTALYRPRAFWRVPNRFNLSRPLLLHQASLDHRYVLSSRTVMQNRFQLSAGEVDYALSSLVFDPAQPTVLNDDVTPVLRAQASSSFGYALQRRWSTGVGLDGSYNAPLYGEDAAGFRTSAVAGVEPFLGHQLDGRNELTLSAYAGLSWFSTGLREQAFWGRPDSESGDTTYAVIAPGLRWSHRITEQTEASLSGGVAYLRVVQGSELLGAREGDAETTPIAEAQMQSQLWRERGRTLLAGAFAQYRWFFDPILGRPVRRVGGGLNATLDLPPDWTVRSALSFFTTVGNDEFAPPEFLTARRFDQTMLRIDVPVTYQASRLIGLEFGIRSNLRGPALGDGVEINRVEFWGYGAVRFVFDPRDSEAGWAR
jgi:hypothetical protein